MVSVVESLRQDHANLAKLLNALERQIGALEAGGVPDYDIVQGALDYCLNYPDLYHHPKEDLVFKRMQARNPAAAAAYGDLLGQHTDLAALTRRFAAAVHNIMSDQEVPREIFVRTARRFLEVYREHMAAEEHYFLPAAERSLSDEDWAEIEAQMAERDDPLFGPSSEEHFAALRKEVLDWAAANP